MKMKKIDIHICKGFIKAFSLSLIAFVNIFLLSQVFKVVKIVGEGKLTGGESILYLLTLLPKIIVEVTPLSILLGGLISMNIMASNLEIISLKTSGISFKRIIVFPVIISFIVSIGVYIISDTIYPAAYNKSQVLRGGNPDREAPVLKQRAFLKGEGDYVYYFGLIDRVKGTAKDVQLIDMNPEFDRIERVITADSAKYNEKKNIWELKKVNINKIAENKVVPHETYSETKYSAVPDDFITIGKAPKSLSIEGLKKEMKDVRAIGGDTKELLQELAKRYAFPWASFVICFTGLALGSRYVRGASAMSIGISIVFGYGYYLLDGVFEAMSKNGFMNPFISSWIPNILFLCIGLYFVKGSEH